MESYERRYLSSCSSDSDLDLWLKLENRTKQFLSELVRCEASDLDSLREQFCQKISLNKLPVFVAGAGVDLPSGPYMVCARSHISPFSKYNMVRYHEYIFAEDAVKIYSKVPLCYEVGRKADQIFEQLEFKFPLV